MEELLRESQTPSSFLGGTVGQPIVNLGDVLLSTADNAVRSAETGAVGSSLPSLSAVHIV